MLRASSCPSSGATTTAVAASGLPSELGDSSAVGRGRAGRPAWPRPWWCTDLQTLNQIFGFAFQCHISTGTVKLAGNVTSVIRERKVYSNLWGAEMTQSVQWLTTALDNREINGSIPRKPRVLSPFLLSGPPSLLTRGYRGLLPWRSPLFIAKVNAECSHFSTLLFAFVLFTGPSLHLLVDSCTVCNLLGILFLQICTSLLLVAGLFGDSTFFNYT